MNEYMKETNEALLHTYNQFSGRIRAWRRCLSV